MCDGTLLQRFVLAFFYFSQGLSPNEELALATSRTCEWPGITCESQNNFVTHLIIPNKDLKGNLITEIGLLTSLKEINLSNNTLSGYIHPSLYNKLPLLEIFNIGANNLGGSIPIEVLIHQKMKEFNVSRNNFVGTLSHSMTYSESLGKPYCTIVLICKVIM